jgi:multicomponent Na+:H+ antiporter subunit E
MPIEPVWARLDTAVGTPLQKTLYANSITLTPGTLTTDVEADHFLVHALSPEGIEDLRRGEMERRIRRLGI